MEITESPFKPFPPSLADILAGAPTVSCGYVEKGLMLETESRKKPETIPDDLVGPHSETGSLQTFYVTKSNPV